MWAYLLQGLGLGFPAAIQPGPFQAYLLAHVSQHGWRRTLPAALAPLISDSPIIFIMTFILSQLPPGFLNGIRIVGGIFILYLAWGAIQGMRQTGHTPQTEEPTSEEVPGIFQAAVMNILNPNPWIFWGTIGSPILIDAWSRGIGSSAAFILGMYVTLIGGMAVLIVVFGQVGRLSPNANRWMNGFAALALLLFGCWQLWSGITPLLS